MIDIICAGVVYTAVLVSCHDGDTCKVKFNEESVCMHFLQEERVRFEGFDTPEINGKCIAEKILARKAKEITENYFRSTKRTICATKKRDEHGRPLVKSCELKELLISKELAYEYHGGKKQKWCKSKITSQSVRRQNALDCHCE